MLQGRHRFMTAVIAAATLVSGPCLATPQQIAWPTFFRAAPTHDGAELQELDRGTVVDVLNCDGDQCQVQYGRVVGYVDRAMLGPPNTPPASLMPPNTPGAAPDANPSCVDSRRAGYEGGMEYTYCQR